MFTHGMHLQMFYCHCISLVFMDMLGNSKHLPKVSGGLTELSTEKVKS